MADDLQSLLERIRKEGVDKADAEAGRIVAEAKAEAARIVEKARQDAAAAAKSGEEKAEAFMARGRKAMEQAARDVLLSVEAALQAALRALVDRKVAEAMSPDFVKQLIVKTVESYCAKGGSCGEIDVLVNSGEQARIADYFLSQFREALHGGLEIHADEQVVTGFRVSVTNEHLYHDFTREAIVEALCQFLRPELAKIVRESVAGAAKTKPDGK